MAYFATVATRCCNPRAVGRTAPKLPNPANPKTFLNDFDLFNGNEPTCSRMTSNVPFPTTTKMMTTRLPTVSASAHTIANERGCHIDKSFALRRT
jgi:hypothetical protein